MTFSRRVGLPSALAFSLMSLACGSDTTGGGDGAIGRTGGSSGSAGAATSGSAGAGTSGSADAGTSGSAGAGTSGSAGVAGSSSDGGETSSSRPVELKSFSTEVFATGQKVYRIPALGVAPNGDTLAFIEERLSEYDQGEIRIMVKRSVDRGQTWLPATVVVSAGQDTIGNPTFLVDKDTSTIWLFATWNKGSDTEDSIAHGTSADTRRVWVLSSKDNGATWSSPLDVTATTKSAGWGWYATGPGNGIQLRSGRLVIPANHNIVPSLTGYSHVIYSDDHGSTWRLGGTAGGGSTNEATVAELTDGSVLMNARNDLSVAFYRKQATSTDRGETWGTLAQASDLPEPNCQASMWRYSFPSSDGTRGRLLFSNPARTDDRRELTLKVSYDEGATWPVSRLIHAGPSAYSSMATLSDGSIGILYEAGASISYFETTRFTHVTIREIENGPLR